MAVGGAFHTPFMAPARNRLRKILATITFHDAEIPVIANVDARQHTAAADWELLLSAQLVSPIRWRQSIMRLGGLVEPGADAERLFVELGPGDALSTMIRNTLPSVSTVAVSAPADLDRLVDAVSGNTALHAYAARPPGRAPLRLRAGGDQPRGRDLPARRRTGAAGRVPPSRWAPCSARSDRGGPLAVRRPPEGTLAHPGERVQTGQPIAWLHAS